MSTKIRLMRMGKIRTPFFRIVVTDSRKARNGLSIEEIGRYVPGQEPSIMEVNSERAQYWLGVGAQPTAAVEAIFKVTGDWQKFKGLPGTEGTLKFATPKPAKSIAYEAAVKQAMDEPKEGATTMKKKAQEKLAAKANPAPVIEEVVSEPTATEEVAVEAVVETAPEAVVEAPAVSEPTATDVVAEVPAEPVTSEEAAE
ncbi:30S ribosomal protein S16 [Candidatus Planktophila lacus]|uniref:30S ribosomal protein S16 n=1 Tax=Candidatus Planktophila lacus TaxID=1884913 RepID=UPI000BACC695|nr:30S ribosomal protein S16 [Candidatus Planktophila lacus]